MTALGVTRFLTQLKDVDPNGLPDDGVPQYQTAVSSFVVQTIAGGGGGSFSLGASNLGNTLGDTGITGTRVVLAGIGNLTLSQATDANGGTISISAGTAAGGGGIALSASDTLFSSGTVVLTGAGGGATVNTVAPGTVQISVAAPVPQTVQTQNLFDLTAGGNTAGVLALVSSGTLTLAGGNSITMSQNGNAITISGATTSQSVQTQPIQTGISSIVASNATYTSGSVQFTGSGIVTIRSSANQRVVVDASQSVQTQNLVALTLSGNTAGALALASSGTVTLAGGNNITLSQAGNAITISGANVGGAQTGISGIANSETTFTSGTVSLSELGAITIRSTTGNQFQFSVNPQSVQPETQTFIGGISASNTLYTSGTVRITGAGNITVASGTGQQIIISGSQSVQPETQTFLGGISASDTLYTSGTVRFTGVGGGVTVSSNTGQRVDISVAAPVAQSVQTQNVVDVTLSGNTAGALALISSGTMTLAGGNNITVSQAGNAVTISGPNTAAQTVESQSIGMSNLGNTSGTTGIASGGQVRFLFAGGNNITLSQSLNGASGTITISAPNLGAGAMSAGVSNLGNTAGSTGVTGTRLVLVGTNGVTLSQSTDANGATVSFSAGGGGGFSAGVSTGGNTAGATGVSGSQMVLVGSGVMSLSQTTGANGNTVSVLGPATSSLVGSSGISVSSNGSTISVFPVNETSYAPFDEAVMVTGTQGQASLHMQPRRIPNMQFDRIGLALNFSNASNSSNSITLSAWIGFYTKNASTMSLLASTSGQTNFSGSGTVGSYSLYGGMRMMTIPMTTTLTASDYYVGIVTRSTTGGGAGHTLQQLLRSEFTNATLSGWSGLMGAAATATAQFRLGLGLWSNTTAGMPNSVAFSDITGSGSLAMREPIFMLRSGTV